MHRFYISPERLGHLGALGLAAVGSSPRTRRSAHEGWGETRCSSTDTDAKSLRRLSSLAKDEIRLRKLHEAETPPLQCRIVLGQAIPKGKNMDLIVQKAVEIGAAEIAPIISDRTIVQVDSETAAQKQSKWQQIAIEAAKQCGQNWLPRVHAPRKLSEFFSVTSDQLFDLQLIGSLQPDARHLKEILANYSSEHQHGPRSVLCLSGPKAISRRRNLRSRVVTAASQSRSAQSFCEWKPQQSIA